MDACLLSLSLGALFLALFSLSGCAKLSRAFSKPEVQTVTSKPAPIVLKTNFVKTDPLTGAALTIKPSELDLSRYIQNLGAYPKESKSANVLAVKLISGLDVAKLRDGSYKLEYYNGETSSNNGDITSSVVFTLKTDVISDDEVSFTFPDTYTTQLVKDDFLTTYDLLDSIDKLEADARSVFAKLNTLKVSANKSGIFSGEVDSKYPSASIYANFKRKLGSYSGTEKISEIKKENTFNVVIAGKNYPLEINIYPYRDGSKVEYSAEVGYTVSSDGKSTLTKADIDKANAQIAQIVND